MNLFRFRGLSSRIVKKGLRLVDRGLRTDFWVRFHNAQIGMHDSKYVFDDDQYAFVHIPKTGGTSVAHSLKEVGEEVFVGLNRHLPVSRECPPQRYKYITFLRDPVDRVWSYYRMVEREGPQFPYHLFTGKGIQFFLEHCWEVRDMACRYFSGYPYSKVDSKRYELARGNLNAFYFVGIFERFEPSLHNLLHGLDRPDDGAPLPHLRSSETMSVPEDVRETIAHYNRHDIALYLECVERFDGEPGTHLDGPISD